MTDDEGPQTCGQEGKTEFAGRDGFIDHGGSQREYAKSVVDLRGTENAEVRYYPEIIFQRRTRVGADIVNNPNDSPDLSSDIDIAKADWETYCSKIADQVVQEQSPANLMKVRTGLYELLSHCIPPTMILKVRWRLACSLPRKRALTI